MSFKDLEEKTTPKPHVDTPAEAALREKAAAHHRAKEEKRAQHAAEHAQGAPAKPEPGKK